MAAPTLVALGDSLTQGFQSGAIERPEWSFPAILARSLGLEVPAQYRVPVFGGPGYPLNVEDMLHSIATRVGDDLGELEWVLRLPTLLPGYLDYVEDYYERGPGSKPLTFDGQFHNLASWGLTVNEALTLTPADCAARIRSGEGWVRDDLFAVPSMPMLRAAKRVLNPADSPARGHATMVENLRALAAAEPVDMLLLWLGHNDALLTVLELEIEEMPANYVSDDPVEREAFNLTSIEQFRRDYTRLADAIDAAIADNPGRRQVYVGTIPHVTIPPITRGLGTQRDGYFERYAWFFSDGHAHKTLSREQVLHIDGRVEAFNEVIIELADAHGWTVVDTATMLRELAVKRNGYIERPGAPLRDYLSRRGHDAHPLLALDPIPNVTLYESTPGPSGSRRTRGGLFSLDHTHPTTLGYGLAAERFLEAIRANNPDDPQIVGARVDWDAVILADTLEQSPPVLWDDFLRHASNCAWLWERIIDLLT